MNKKINYPPSATSAVSHIWCYLYILNTSLYPQTVISILDLNHYVCNTLA